MVSLLLSCCWRRWLARTRKPKSEAIKPNGGANGPPSLSPSSSPPSSSSSSPHQQHARTASLWAIRIPSSIRRGNDSQWNARRGIGSAALQVYSGAKLFRPALIERHDQRRLRLRHQFLARLQGLFWFDLYCTASFLVAASFPLLLFQARLERQACVCTCSGHNLGDIFLVLCFVVR